MSGAQFIAGKAEEVMPGRLDLPLAGLGEVVGVVDPPRNGLRESPAFTPNEEPYIKCSEGGLGSGNADLRVRLSLWNSLCVL